MATTSNTFCANKMTADEAAKISAEKTRVELEKLQKTIKDNNAFENVQKMKNPSDVESIGSTSDEDIDDITSHPVKRKRVSNTLTMEDRMYSDNQKLWKKNQDLKLELEKTSKQLRYLQFEHNNKCIEITNLNTKLKDYSSLRVACFYARLNIFMCYLIIISMIAQYVYAYPVIDFAVKSSRDLLNHSIEITSIKAGEIMKRIIEFKE